MYIIHILMTNENIEKGLFRKRIISPDTLVPGENCSIAQRIIERDEAILPHGQQFIPGLVVDASFERREGFHVSVSRVRCSGNVVEVYFTLNTNGDHAYELEKYGYAIINTKDALSFGRFRPALGYFLPTR